MISYFMAFAGVYSIIPTAFTESGEIDEASQRRVVDLFIAKGANGLTALGVTGEVARLEEHERAKVLEIVVKQAAGRVPIVAGTSAEGTRTCISYTRQAKDLGAAAVMVSPPRMPKLNSNAVVANEIQTQSKLVFNRYGDHYFLSQVWTAGNSRGRQLLKSGREREMAQVAKIETQGQITLVAGLPRTNP